MSADLPRQCFRKSPEETMLEREAASCHKCIFQRIYWGTGVCALTGEFAQDRCPDYEDAL